MTFVEGHNWRERSAAQMTNRLVRVHACSATAKRLSLICPHFTKWLGREDGQAMIEMAISLMVVFSLVFWLFELCILTYTCSVLNNATEEGLRYAIMHGSDSSTCSGPDSQCTDQAPYSNVQAVVTGVSSASLHDMSAMTIRVSYDNGTAAPGNPVTVTVAYTYVPFLNLPGLQNAVRFVSRGQILY